MKMKTDMKYFLGLAAAAVAAVSSCTGVRVETDDIVPSGTPIRLSVSSDGPQTKAMFDRTSFSAMGNVLQIWDVYSNSVVEPFAYIAGANVVSGGDNNSIWPFRSDENPGAADEHYYWTKTGKHRFYGVLTKDNSAGATNVLRPGTGWGFDEAHKVYSVPKTTLTLASPQFDFVYSNIRERDLDNGDGTSAVPMQFRHLFSAFGFTFNNDSPSDFEIKSVALKADNVASATIDYSSAWDPDYVANGLPEEGNAWEPQVDYNDLSMSPSTGIAGKAATVGAVKIYDLFHGTTLTRDDLRNYMDYRLIWPQNLKGSGTSAGKTLEISYHVTVKKSYEYFEYDAWSGGWTVEFRKTDAGKGTYEITSQRYWDNSNGSWTQKYVYEYVGEGKGSYYIYNSYSSTNGVYKKVEYSKTEGQDNTMSIGLADITPGAVWEPGKRYLYNLAYSNNELGLKVSVMQWDGDHGGDVEFN